MPSQKISSLESATKNLDLTLELEVPLEPSGSCSSSLDISLGPVKIQLGTSQTQGSISGEFTKEDLDMEGDLETGSSASPPTTGVWGQSIDG
jgi:hypothetical protein